MKQTTHQAILAFLCGGQITVVSPDVLKLYAHPKDAKKAP